MARKPSEFMLKTHADKVEGLCEYLLYVSSSISGQQATLEDSCPESPIIKGLLVDMRNLRLQVVALTAKAADTVQKLLSGEVENPKVTVRDGDFDDDSDEDAE